MINRDLDSFALKLYNSRKTPCSNLPDKVKAEKFADEILSLLFPHFSKDQYSEINNIELELNSLKYQLFAIIKPLDQSLENHPEEISNAFFDKISEVHDLLLLDAESIAKNDPAANNVDEVILTYPGFLAISIYRIAHIFHSLKVPLFPRVLTEYAHSKTGIDIHPAARIGKSFCIDHGTGVVIGETTWIGDNVKIYQGVTLGALSVNKNLSKVKRHPTVEDNCVIYSNATILGGDTIIGHDSVIGGNVWLTQSVNPFSIVYHKSEIKLSNAKDFQEAINFVI